VCMCVCHSTQAAYHVTGKHDILHVCVCVYVCVCMSVRVHVCMSFDTDCISCHRKTRHPAHARACVYVCV